MGILETLASIPTASNLVLKLKDSEAKLKTLNDENVKLKAENEQLTNEVKSLNAQVNVLTSRIESLPPPSTPKLARQESATSLPWKARDW